MLAIRARQIEHRAGIGTGIGGLLAAAAAADQHSERERRMNGSRTSNGLESHVIVGVCVGVCVGDSVAG